MSTPTITPSNTPPARRRGLPAALLAAAVAGLAAGPGPAAAQQGPPPAPVEAVEVRVDTVRDEVLAVGSLRSNESVVIRPEIAGRIVAIEFEEGEAVEAGQPLVRLDDSVYRAELAQAKARLELSRRNFERAKELFARNAASARARDEARANLEVDRAAVDLAESRLAKTVIRAPFAGLVGLRRISAGAYVSPGQDVAELVSLDPIKVDFRVPERNLPALRTGQTLWVRVDAFPGETFEGRVYALAPQVEEEGRSLAVRASIPNSDRRLRAGLFARVRLVTESRADAILVPEPAVVPRGNGRFVYKVVDGRAVEVEVTIGKRRGGWVEVVSGLSAGDVVVSAGHLRVRDGSPVNVMEPSAGAVPGQGS